MKFALPSIAIALAIQQPHAVASSGSNHGGRSHLPSTYVRSMGLKALRKARSKALVAAALAHRQRRLTTEGADTPAPPPDDMLAGFAKEFESLMANGTTDMDFEDMLTDLAKEVESLMGNGTMDMGFEDMMTEFESLIGNGTMDMGFDSEGLDLENLNLESLLGDLDFEGMMGDAMSSVVPMMCSMLDMGADLVDSLQDLSGQAGDVVPALNMTCATFGCDDAEPPNLVMECSLEGDMCVDYGGEKYCATATTVSQTTSLNLTGVSAMESTQCNEFTSPQRMADMGRVCVTISAEIDYGALLSDTFADFGGMLGGEAGEGAGGAVDVAEAEEPDMDDFFRITSCSSSFDGGTKAECGCGICDDGMGFRLTCPNNLISVECTDFEGATDMGALAGGEAQTPGVSVLRLVALPDTDAVTADAGDTTSVATNGDGESSAAATATPATTTATTTTSTNAAGGTGSDVTVTADDENEDDTSSAASYPDAVAASLVMACASFVALL